MAKPTIASLTKELEAAQEQIAKLKAAQGEDTEKLTVLPEGEYIPKEEFEKLQTQFQNLSNEHDELVLRYEADPELAAKVERAVEKLSDKPKALLFKKISLALGEVKRIPKNGWNDFHKYKYSQEGDILDGIRPILSDVGLMLWTTIADESRKIVDYFSRGKEVGKRTLTKVKVEYTIGCADTGETLSSFYYGEGEDESDKGLYKAYTGATKYFLTKNFLISSGDILQDNEPSDPEADTQRYKDQPQRSKQNQGQRQPQRNSAPPQPTEDEIKAKELEAKNKAEAKELWVKLAGNEEGFEGFYKKQTKEKEASHTQIMNFLNGRLAEKQKEAAENPQEGAGEAEQQQEEQSPPPPQKEPQNENKHPDDMTPEEYVSYVEDSLPFPLTPNERDNLLADARAGNRNHRN
jgi:ERF superfamily